ncbi:MAG: S8 family serine peptidase [Isosphaeraceae bacterium]
MVATVRWFLTAPTQPLHPVEIHPVMSHRRRQRQTVRPRLEHLENRLVLSTAIPSTSAKNLLSLGESYVAGDLKINLDRRPDEFAIAVNSGTVSSLLAGTPLLSGYTIERELTSTIAILRRGAINTVETTKVTPFDPAHPESLVGLVSGVSWVSPLYQSSYSNTWMVATNEVIVALKPGQSASDFFASDSRFTGFRPLLGTNDQYVGTVAAGAGAASVGLASDLTNDARLAWVSPNFYQDFRKFATPNDPLYADQWHLNNTGQAGGTAGEDVDAPLAWDVETGNSNTVISIVDDGMEFTHPDISPNLYVNSAEIANGIDDDGNGWIDDFNGWDFTGTGDNNPGPSTVDDAHATSVAGVAAGRGNNGIGVTGASQLASIVPVRIFLGGSATSDANIASAVNYAAGRTANGLGTWLNVSAMNNSWGGGSPSAAITAAFTWASNNARGGLGTATFIASGNDFSSAVSYPSSLAGTLPGVMAVGASTNVATRSTYSNYGAQLSFVAPSSGVTYGGTADITTTDRVGNNGYNAAGTGDGDPLADTNYTSVFGGTSSATPLSVGIGALVLSRAADLGISLTAAQVKGLLQNTTEYIGPASVSYNATTGFNVEYGYGRINANNAVRGVGVREIQVLDGRTNVADGSTVSLGTLVLPEVSTGSSGSATRGHSPRSVEPGDQRKQRLHDPDRFRQLDPGRGSDHHVRRAVRADHARQQVGRGHVQHE